MNECDKRALCDYAQTFYITWEVGGYNSDENAEGLYKFWYPFSNFDKLKDKEFVPVYYYSGFGWKLHGKMTWEAVRKLIDAHRAGIRETELGSLVHCEFFKPIWN